MGDFLADATLRRLVAYGFENVRRFSWAAAARRHLDVYEELAAMRPGHVRA